MCIRDRFKGKALVSATPLKFSDPRFEENGFSIIKIEPTYDYAKAVSYTHLDVYKRQRLPLLPVLHLLVFGYPFLQLVNTGPGHR